MAVTKAWTVGPKGGRYYVARSGQKMYGKEAEAAARAEKAGPTASVKGTRGDPAMVKLARARKTPPKEAQRQADIAKQSGPAADAPHYHGTDAVNIESILKNGIQPTDTSLGTKTAWMSTGPNLAHGYAAGAAVNAGHDEYAIVVVKSGKDAGLSSFRGDKSAGYSFKTIPPENIDHIEVYKVGAGKDDKPVRIVPGPGEKDPLKSLREAREKAPTSAELIQKTLADGGLTYDAIHATFPQTGFVVSIHPEHEEAVSGKDMNAAKLSDYLERKKSAIEASPGAHLGAWYDTKSDKWVLDVSHVATSNSEARELSIKHGQFAYFDLAKKEEVRMDSDPEWLAKWGGKRKIE